MRLVKYLGKSDELKALVNQTCGALFFMGKVKGRENKILGIRVSKPTEKVPGAQLCMCCVTSPLSNRF